MHLRGHQLGVQFRRQHPIGPYIVDFCCVERMLIVELDGGQHEDQRARDEACTQWLGGRGFRVLRFSDREALMQTEVVLTEIQNQPLDPHPNPPPKLEGEGVRTQPTLDLGKNAADLRSLPELARHRFLEQQRSD